MGTNLLINSELKGFTLFREFKDKSGTTGWMEHPDNWEFIFTPMHPDDPNRVPQSLHRDLGFGIAAGFRKWEAGYVQRGVILRKGHRYLCKANFTPHAAFSDKRPDDWRTHIQWHFVIEGSGQKIESNWSSTSHDSFGHDEEHLMVIEPLNDMAANFAFVAQSRWESNSCEFNVRQLALEEVPADYGMPVYIGTPSTEPAVPPPSFAPEPRTRKDITLDEALTDADIDVIVPGLRAAAASGLFGQAINDGFTRLADVLERMKGSQG